MHPASWQPYNSKDTETANLPAMLLLEYVISKGRHVHVPLEQLPAGIQGQPWLSPNLTTCTVPGSIRFEHVRHAHAHALMFQPHHCSQ